MRTRHASGWYRVAVAAVLLVALAACGTVRFGRDFDLKAFESKVRHGESTEAQVRDWLGEPPAKGFAVDDKGDRLEEWNYYFGEGSLPSMEDARFKSLRVKFDPKGVVREYSWSAETPRKQAHE